MERKRNPILIMAAVAFGVLLIAGAYWAGTSKKEETQPTKVSPAATVKGTAAVGITAKGFSPATITVNKGTLVTFTNKDKKEHRVASDPHPTHTSLKGFDSVSNLKQNDTYSFLFSQKGTYTYHDHPNPLRFKGIIIVE